MNAHDDIPHPEIRGRLSKERPHIHLRLLETTDIHSNLLPFDYYADTCETSFGLARTATLIQQARNEAENCLLLDNGDFLQGTPLSDLTAQPDSGWTGAHPAVTAMNYLKYDAAGVGNHEFNFGLDWLRAALADATFPVTCANAVTKLGTGPHQDQTLFAPYLILDRSVTDSSGARHDLRIGVIGLVPPQITTWDHYFLQDRLRARDMLEAAGAWVPKIRAEGADLIVALAHTGIDAQDYYPMKENAALALSELPGIDAILAGHTHEVFPDPDEPDIAGADNAGGTLNGTPTVMAGFRGSHLGVLDLYLEKAPGGWSVVAHRSAARRVQSRSGDRLTPPDEDFKKLLWPVHERTLDLIRRPLGHSAVPLHTYLALVRNDPTTQLISRAKHAALAQLVRDTPDADLPIISSSAPYKTGGRGGPKYFSDVPQGDFRLRNAADLYAFPNTLCGVRMTGSQLRDWLERAASCFNQIHPHQPDQPLMNPLVPGHNFDVLDGLTYVIDLSQPARYDGQGRMICTQAKRIVELSFDGKPLEDDQLFLLATNSFRAHGGGPYPQMPEESFAVTSQIKVRDILAQFVRDRGDAQSVLDPVWSFAPLPGASVTFDTGPGIRRYPEDVAALGAVDLGDTPAGFARLRFSLEQKASRNLANPVEAAYVQPREVGAGERLANPVRSGRKQP